MLLSWNYKVHLTMKIILYFLFWHKYTNLVISIWNRKLAKIIKFEIWSVPSEVHKQVRSGRVEMSSKTRFWNNGGATVTQGFLLSKSVRERLEMETMSSVSDICPINVSWGRCEGGSNFRDFSRSRSATGRGGSFPHYRILHSLAVELG